MATMAGSIIVTSRLIMCPALFMSSLPVVTFQANCTCESTFAFVAVSKCLVGDERCSQVPDVNAER